MRRTQRDRSNAWSDWRGGCDLNRFPCCDACPEGPLELKWLTSRNHRLIPVSGAFWRAGIDSFRVSNRRSCATAWLLFPSQSRSVCAYVVKPVDFHEFVNAVKE